MKSEERRGNTWNGDERGGEESSPLFIPLKPMVAGFVFLFAVAEAVDYACHHVGWDDVGGLAAEVATALGVFHMLEILENVEAFEHYH